MQNNQQSNNLFYAFSIWIIAAIFYAYEFLHRVAPSVLTGDLRAHFEINDSQLGIMAALYFYAYALCQIPAGMLIDRFGAKKLLVLASISVCLGSFLFTCAPQTSWLYISRVLIGAGSAFAFVGTLQIARFWLPLSIFPLLVGLTNLFGTLGALSGGTPLAYVLEFYSWQNVMFWISIAGVIVTALLIFGLPSKNPDPIQQSKHSFMDGLSYVLGSKQAWLIALYGAILVAPIATIPEMWGVEFVKLTYSLTTTQASKITHTIFIGTALGGPIIGFIASKISQKSEDPAKGILNFMFFSTLIALLLLAIFISGVIQANYKIYLVLFFYGIFTTNMLLCFSLIAQLQPKWAQGAAIGFTNTIIMLGSGSAQLFSGWLINLFRAQHNGLYFIQDYQLALAFLPALLIIAMALTRIMRA